MEPLYTTEALATGEGRNGHVRTIDGALTPISPFPLRWAAPARA